MKSLPHGLIKYQKRDAGNYRRIHFTFSELSYKLAIDYRNFNRISVSHIVTLAVNAFKEKPIRDEDMTDFNLPVNSLYQIDRIEDELNIKWIICWGHSKKRIGTNLYRTCHLSP